MWKWFPDVLIWTIVVVLGAVVGVRQLATGDARNGAPSFRGGPELLAILFTSATCAAANEEDFPDLYDRVIRRLRADATTHEVHLATMGVAIDWDIDAGLQALRRLGRFDEIAVGRNWLNSTALRLLAPTAGGTPTIPQVIVVSRHVSQNSGQIETTEDDVVLRLVGPEAIVAWERDGASLSWEN